MNLNPFHRQPLTCSNIIPDGEGYYIWRWFKWRRIYRYKRGAMLLSRGALERLKEQKQKIPGEHGELTKVRIL